MRLDREPSTGTATTPPALGRVLVQDTRRSEAPCGADQARGGFGAAPCRGAAEELSDAAESASERGGLSGLADERRLWRKVPGLAPIHPHATTANLINPAARGGCLRAPLVVSSSAPVRRLRHVLRTRRRALLMPLPPPARPPAARAPAQLQRSLA